MLNNRASMPFASCLLVIIHSQNREAEEIKSLVSDLEKEVTDLKNSLSKKVSS